MANTIDKTKIDWPATLDLKTAAFMVGLTGMRLRTLAREGQAPAKKNENGAWEFNRDELMQWMENRPARQSGGPRGDGKKWIITIKHADLEKVKAALQPFGIKLEPRYNYEKQKAYRQKRDARLKAEKAKNAPVPSKK